jgi:F-type H+-transporting ATPase subunit gamma
MENLRDLRRRRRSVQSTQQITRAMKMVSAAKLRRAQEVLLRARPYAEQIDEIILDLVHRERVEAHPLLQVREGKRWALIVIAADRGLCGAYNANAFKFAERFLRDHADREIRLRIYSRKAYDYFKRRRIRIDELIEGLEKKVSFAFAEEEIAPYIEAYAAGELDRVAVIYARFHSALRQELLVQDLLPIHLERRPGRGERDFRPIYEPNAQRVLAGLLPRYVAAQFYRILLEAQASEHGSRMTSMDNATNNANELIEKLTLRINRARQAAITKEILEIVGGAEALKGRG